MSGTIPGARCVALLIIGPILGACGSAAKLPVASEEGPAPAMPAPEHSLIPTVNVVEATGWTHGATPIAAPGTSVAMFAAGLQHPRWLYVLPNGDVLVAETNAPERPDDGKGLKAWFVRHYQAKAGGAVPSPDRIVLLRDTNGDGVADKTWVILAGLPSPFGMALVGDDLYVANTAALVRFRYHRGDTLITTPGRTITALPAGPIDHHWTKSLLANADGSKLYVGVGSNSNAAENGLDKETERASIWEVDAATGAHRIYASGLRNPVGLAWEPSTGVLWVAVNERDELGGDLVPDYMTGVREGAFYGWPYSYYGSHIDTRVKPQDTALVARAIVPDYALGAHTASLGLAWSAGKGWPAPYGAGMFVGQHGSWNRKPRSGYKVIFVPFANGKPDGMPVDVLTGFVTNDGKAMGRPVGVAIDHEGALLVADDVGNTIWRVRPAPLTASH